MIYTIDIFINLKNHMLFSLNNHPMISKFSIFTVTNTQLHFFYYVQIEET